MHGGGITNTCYLPIFGVIGRQVHVCPHAFFFFSFFFCLFIIILLLWNWLCTRGWPPAQRSTRPCLPHTRIKPCATTPSLVLKFSQQAFLPTDLLWSINKEVCSNMGVSQYKVFISQPVTMLGIKNLNVLEIFYSSQAW